MVDLVKFLVTNTFILIPIYVLFLLSTLIFIFNKIFRSLNEIDRLLNKTKSLSKTIDNTLKMLAEEEYNVKKRQKETLQDMILLRELLKNIREVLENYFSELKSIKKKSTKSTEAVDKNERKLQ